MPKRTYFGMVIILHIFIMQGRRFRNLVIHKVKIHHERDRDHAVKK